MVVKIVSPAALQYEISYVEQTLFLDLDHVGSCWIIPGFTFQVRLLVVRKYLKFVVNHL